MKSNQLTIDRLNVLLADYQIFYQNLRGFHWNIQGKNFFELHVKFEELYTDAALKIDLIAERILTIYGTPLHSFQDYLDSTTILSIQNVHDGVIGVKTIVTNLDSLLKSEREIKAIAAAAEDSGTEDQMSAFIEEQEKVLWMYRAWLK